jgi:hypothetical protein
MAEFGCLLVEIDEPLCAAPADLFLRHPAMRAGIRLVGFNRAAEWAVDSKVYFVSVYSHGFTFSRTTRPPSRLASRCASRLAFSPWNVYLLRLNLPK